VSIGPAHNFRFSLALPLTGGEVADYPIAKNSAHCAASQQLGSFKAMSTKAERGTKRVCQSCGSKFYDLMRDPIICPICQAVYQDGGAQARMSAGGNNLDAEDDAVLDAGRGGLEFVPLDEVAAREEELPDIEGGDIGGDADDDEALDTGGEDEPFLESEDEGEADVSGFGVGGGKDDEN
jgi:uncharacterized protein (TIGR02300 family)